MKPPEENVELAVSVACQPDERREVTPSPHVRGREVRHGRADPAHCSSSSLARFTGRRVATGPRNSRWFSWRRRSSSTPVTPHKFHLCRAFRDEIGLPPHAYLVHLRIARALDLLRARLPASRVAAEVGIYDQSQLNRHFKRIVGLTPGQYARALE